MEECLFCKMVSGKIKPNVVYENDHILAFRDINPQAPSHVLIIPKQHIANLNDLNELSVAGELLLSAKKVAEMEGLSDDGYRTVINCNKHGGQEVYHIHVHLLGGRRMTWPPG